MHEDVISIRQEVSYCMDSHVLSWNNVLWMIYASVFLLACQVHYKALLNIVTSRYGAKELPTGVGAHEYQPPVG